MQTIFVTGAAGYLGSILIPTLLEKKYKVIALDTFSRNDSSLLSCVSNPNFLPIRGDVRDRTLIKECLKKTDFIIPLAGLVGAPICEINKFSARSINVDSIAMLCKLANNNQHIIYPTTNSGYGIGEQNILCTEDTPLNPISLYATTKVEAEKIILETGHGTTLRLATVFGMSPRMRIDLLVNHFTYRAVTDRFVVLFEGHAKRNYIHIRDVAKVFLHTIKHTNIMNNNAYNVGLSSANLSKVDLCEKIKTHIKEFVYFLAPIGEDPDKRDYIISNEKIEKTGWIPEYTLDMGIVELIRGYRMIHNTCFSNH